MPPTIENDLPTMPPSSLPSPPNRWIWGTVHPDACWTNHEFRPSSALSYRCCRCRHGQGNVSTSSGGGGIVLSLGGRGNRFSQKAKLPTEILPFGHHGEEMGWGSSFSAGGQKRKSLRSEFGVKAMVRPRAVCGGMDDSSLSAVARAEHHLRRHHHRHCDVGGASSVERQSMESHWNLKFEWPLF